MRTRVIDDFLTSDPQTAQAVVLGAGLDTRAYRLPWPAGARVIEIDHPNVLEFKASVMAGLSAEPAGELISVATDLSRPWREPLLAAGFDPHEPTTWVLEGLLPYLDAAAQLAVLEEVAELSASGSRVVIERAVPLPKTDDLDAKLRDFSLQTGLSMSELLARADPPDPVGPLESAGWRCSEHTVAELCSLYGRSLSLTGTVTGTAASGSEPMGESGPSRGGFVTAWRQ
jgi:methyltransferase (TIGR00027 family)